MANKKISELPYINGGKISGNTLVPLVTYFSAATGDTVHTFIGDFQSYLISGLTGNTDVFVTGGTYSAGTITFTNNTGGTFNVTGLTTGSTSIISGEYLPLSGGTVTGGTIFQSGLTANTLNVGGVNVDVTELQNRAIVVTGGTVTAENDKVYHSIGGGTTTYNDPTGVEGRGFWVFVRIGTSVIGGSSISINGTLTFRIYSAGAWATYNFLNAGTISTIYVPLTRTINGKSLSTDITLTPTDVNALPISGGTVTGSTQFTAGLSANTISATTYQNLPDNLTGNYLPLSGGTVSGNTIFTSGLTGVTLDISGKTTTTNLQVTSGASVGYVLTAIDSSGNTRWESLGSDNNELDPVLSITGTTPGSAVTIGDRYLISGGTGIWSGRDNQIAEYTGTGVTDYSYYIPVLDDVVYVTDTLTTYRFNGTNWTAWRGVAILQNGNSLTTSVNIGTNNGRNLTFKTNNQTRVNIDTSGTTNIIGKTNFVQTGGLDIVTFSSSTAAYSGQSMFIRQTASSQYVFGSGGPGVGIFMRVGPTNVVNFEGQTIQSLFRGAQFGSSLSNPVQIPYAINISTLPSQSTGTTSNIDALRINPSITTTATYTGTYRGIYYNPTVSITTGTTHLAIETVRGDVIFGSTSGNVGIGTTTPSEKLDVSGKTKTTNLQVTSGATAGYVLTSDASGNASWQASTGGSTFTGGTVTGSTIFTNGLTANTISATTLTVNGVNITGDTYVTGLTFNTSNYNLTIGRNDGVSFTDSLAILASDLTVTGGTYNPNNGTATFTNNTGGTFNVTGFLTGLTDTFVTGGTYSNGTATFTNTSGGTFNVSGFTQPFSGGSGNCITDLYITNLYGCSPITVHDTIETVTGKIRTSGGTGAELNLKDVFGPNGTWSITSDNANYGAGSSWVYGEPNNGTQIAYQIDSYPGEAIGIGIYDNFSDLLFTGKEIVISNNKNNSSSTGISDRRSVFIGSKNSTSLSGITNSVVIGGNGITASTNDTVYVDNLNIKTIGSGTSIINLGLDINGNVVTGTTGGGTFTGGTVSGSTIFTNGLSANTISATTYQNLPDNVTGRYLPLSGGTVTGNTIFTSGLTANTLNVTGNTNVRAFTGTTGYISGSGQNILTVIGSGNSTTSPLFSVQGSSGELFSVTDSLTGSLFSVNDISGLPILETFSDNTTLWGSYQAPSLNTTTRTSLTAGTNTIYSIPTSAYTGAFYEYTLISSGTTGARAGQIMSIWSGTTANFTETSTTDIGTTTGVTFTVAVSGNNAVLSSSATTAGWTVKTIIRSI